MSKFFVTFLSTFVILAFVIANFQVKADEVLPDGCICKATDDLDPVCGNNGVTYPNLMTLRCADNCVKYSIHLMHHGPCKT